MERSARALALLALLATCLAPALEPAVSQPTDAPDPQFSGLVLDAEGKPVEGAWVHWSWKEVRRALLPGMIRNSSTVTDAEGRFLLKGRSPSRRIYAAVPGGSAGFFEPPSDSAGSVRTGIEIRLRADLYFRCEVRTPDEELPKRVELEFRWTGRDPWTPEGDNTKVHRNPNPYRVAADFEIHGLNGLPFDLYLNVYGYRVVRLPSSSLLPGEDGKPKTASVVLETGQSISGLVLTASGEPISGTCVHVNRREHQRQPFYCRHGHTRKDGTFTVSGIEEGTYSVRVNGGTREKPVTVVVDGVKTGTKDLVLRFE